MTVGLGLTVMVNVVGGPLQGLLNGVTVIVAVIGFAVVLVAVKALIFPFPEAGKPMAGLSFVHV